MSQPLPELRYFNTGEVAIHFAEWHESTDESGNAPPAYVFIHGITGRHETWTEVSSPIRRGSRAVAVDLRGHGRSGHAAGAYRVPDYALDVARLVEHRGLAPVRVVGHSLGAMTAVQLAAERPELVESIVLEDPPLFARHIMEEVEHQRYENFGHSARMASSGLSVDELAAQVRSATPDATEDDVRKRALSLFVTDADAIMHVYDQRIDWSSEIVGIMQSVKCPTLLMQGNFELGAWMMADDGTRAKSLIPDCTLKTWEDTGHSMHSEHPERFIEQVNGFAAGLRAAGRSS